jgi:flagellar biosynthesis chaperone FliJ
MSKYIKSSPEKKSSSLSLSSKRQRRSAVKKIIEQLERVKESESAYCERIPENLQSSARFESAETWISVLDETIELLEELP